MVVLVQQRLVGVQLGRRPAAASPSAAKAPRIRSISRMPRRIERIASRFSRISGASRAQLGRLAQRRGQAAVQPAEPLGGMRSRSRRSGAAARRAALEPAPASARRSPLGSSARRGRRPAPRRSSATSARRSAAPPASAAGWRADRPGRPPRRCTVVSRDAQPPRQFAPRSARRPRAPRSAGRRRWRSLSEYQSSDIIGASHAAAGPRRPRRMRLIGFGAHPMTRRREDTNRSPAMAFLSDTLARVKPSPTIAVTNTAARAEGGRARRHRPRRRRAGFRHPREHQGRGDPRDPRRARPNIPPSTASPS